MKLKLLEKLGFSITYVSRVFNWRQQNCARYGAKSRTRWFVSKPPAVPAALGAPSTGKLECAQLQSTGRSRVVTWRPKVKLQLQEHLWERKKAGYVPIVLPPAAYQTVPFHFSHCSACRNVFLNENGRHCNDNQGQTKLAWKCMTDFLPSLPFCYAAHLAFWSVSEVELSPPLHCFLHQYCCDAKLGLSSGTASSATGQWGEHR